MRRCLIFLHIRGGWGCGGIIALDFLNSSTGQRRWKVRAIEGSLMEGRKLRSWTGARWMGSQRVARGGEHGGGGDERGRIWEALLAWSGTEGGHECGSPLWEAGWACLTARWMG
jgi:hypothetical protein